MNNNQGDSHSPEQNDAARQLAQLRGECERLQQIVQRLEQEKERDAEALAAVRAELKGYEHLMLNLIAEQWPPDMWEDFKEEDYNITAEELIEELEELERQQES